MLSIQDLTIVCHWWPFPSSPHWVLGHVAPLEEASLPLCCPLTTPLLLPSASPFSSWTDSCSHLTAVVEFPVEAGELQELEQPAGVFLAVAPLWQSHLPGLNNHHWHTKKHLKRQMNCVLWFMNKMCVLRLFQRGVGKLSKNMVFFWRKNCRSGSHLSPFPVMETLGSNRYLLAFYVQEEHFLVFTKKGGGKDTRWKGERECCFPPAALFGSTHFSIFTQPIASVSQQLLYIKAQKILGNTKKQQTVWMLR